MRYTRKPVGFTRTSGIKMEFLIRRTDGEWFSLHKDHFQEVLKPKQPRTELCHGNGDHCIELPNGRVVFAFEDPGLHIMFEEYEGTREDAMRIVKEILENLTAFSGEKGEIVEL